MKILDGIEKKSPKDRVITLRVSALTEDAINRISKHFNISKADLIEHLVEMADKEFKSLKKRVK